MVWWCRRNARMWDLQSDIDMVKRVCCLIVLLLVWGGAHAQQLPGNVVVRNLKGEKVTMQEILKGEGVILSFWSTTCKPCLSELAALMKVKEQWIGKKRIIAISIDDTRSMAKVKSLAAGNKWEFEVFIDVNKDLYRALNLNLIPTSMVVNKEGEVVYSHTGYMPGDELVLLEEAFKKLK